MNIKDSYIHNGTAVLKDIQISGSTLQKMLAGKDASDAYLGWTTVLDLSTIKPSTAGTADSANKINTDAGSSVNPVYFSNGIPVACDLSTTYAPYNSAGYLPLSGGTLKSDTFRSQLEIWRNANGGNAAIAFFNGTTKTHLGTLAIQSVNGKFKRYKTDDSTAYDILDSSDSSVSGNTITINGTSTTWTNVNAAYLEKSGGTMTGTLNTHYNAVGINFRGAASLAWDSWAAHETAENEALVFGTQHQHTAFMFINAESYTNVSSSRFKYLTPALTIQSNKVLVNAPYASTRSGYNFEVYGTAKITSDTEITGALTASSINVSGAATFSSTIQGNITGNAGTATLLQNARNIKIGGQTLSFNGGSDLEFSLASIGAQASGNYKTVQTAVTSNSADTGSTTTFISSVTQDTNGVITAKTKTLDTSGTWSGTANCANRIDSCGSKNVRGVSYYYLGGSTKNDTVDGSWSGYSDKTKYVSILRLQSHVGSDAGVRYYIDLIFDVDGGNHVTYRRVTNSSTPSYETLAWVSDIPTNNNQLTNGAGYITSSGSITGSAAQIKTNTRSTNANHYLTFVDSDNSSATAETLYTDGGIYYNPSSNTLNVSGDLHVGSMIYGASELTSLTITGGSSVPTQSLGTSNNTIASTAFVANAISALIGSAPGTLDTLKELADALGNDPNYATTITTALAGKQTKVSAMGSTTQPVYVSTDGTFSTCNSYPTKSSWNYDDTYLKLSGGTLTGTLIIKTSTSSWTEGIRILDSTNGWTALLLGGSAENNCSEATWSFHTKSNNFYLANNGSSSFTNGLSWVSNNLNLKAGGTFTFNSNTIYHSGNFTAGTGASNYCAGNDSRLSDARTPTAHTHKWANLDTAAAVAYNTAPEFGSVKIGNGTTSATATSYCKQEYDATNKCLKFIFG